jgi:thiosulfate reductase cytochrome b subunit
MSSATKRSIVRWIHIVLGIPIVGYIYSPFEQIPNYAPATRFVFVPLLVLSGLWMWKGHVVRRLFSKERHNQMLPERGLQSEKLRS